MATAMERGAILVVDDDSAARAMLGLSLRRAGFSVVTAADGRQALDALEKNPIVCLITDAVMRPMDGFELSRRAKALRPRLKIAMVSAIESAAGRREAPTPIDRFFAKPIPVDGLLGWLAGSA